MHYNCMNNSDNFTEYEKNAMEGTRKYIDFCNSLNNVGQDNSNAIYDAFEKEIDLFSICHQMPYQQRAFFGKSVVAACLTRLCGLKL